MNSLDNGIIINHKMDEINFNGSKFQEAVQYVVPIVGCKDKYSADYILSPVGNYGIIINDKVNWFETGTNMFVMSTPIELMIYSIISEDHKSLLMVLNNNGIDPLSHIRADKSHFSKKSENEWMKNLNDQFAQFKNEIGDLINKFNNEFPNE